MKQPTSTPAVSAIVLGESRSLPLRNGEFTDEFKPYEVHLYELRHGKQNRT
jgi:hypothetical protein